MFGLSATPSIKPMVLQTLLAPSQFTRHFLTWQRVGQESDTKIKVILRSTHCLFYKCKWYIKM